ncbi:MAG TPA: DUF4350 domain-containing protein [Acidimicrobiia bacterium]
MSVAAPGVPAATGRGTRALHPAARFAVVALALVVLVNVALALLDSTTRGADEAAPRSSSFSTGSTGVAAWGELLRRNDRPTRALRGGLTDESLASGSTLVVLDPDGVDADEARHVRAFVEGGGRLVAGGSSVGSLLRELLDDPPRWSPAGVGRAVPEGEAPEVNGIAGVVTADEGSWGEIGETEAILGRGQRTLATVAAVGDGRVVMLADASPLQNRLLDRADNAAFALGVVGASGPVQFAEGQHGYGEATGLGAIPTRWKWALAGLAVAGLGGAVAAGRRLGPPEDAARSLPPPRRVYVDALGEALARSRRPAVALAPLQAAVRARLASRAGLGADATEAQLRAAAARFGWSAAETDALFEPPRSDDDVLAAGSALARVTGGGEE